MCELIKPAHPVFHKEGKEVKLAAIVFTALAALCGQAVVQAAAPDMGRYYLLAVKCDANRVVPAEDRPAFGMVLNTMQKADYDAMVASCKFGAENSSPPRAAVVANVPSPPAGYGQNAPSTRLAGGLREGPWERVPAPSRAGSGPRCPGQMKFDPALKKCKSEFRDIPLSPQNQAALSNCPTQIMVRHVWKGNRYVQQQRCKW